jgi:hypothetical protein
MVYNTAYGELYVDFTVPAVNGKSQLLTTYPPASIDSFFQSFYFDEPFQLSAQYRGEIQKFIKDHYQSANQNFEVNSAVGGAPKHLLDFDKKYANYDEEEGTYKKYLLYNMYPIVSNTTTLTASLQPRFDLFINYNNVDDELGTHHDPAKYKYVGILPAILAAKEANIPLFSTICVAAEQYVKNTGGALSLVDGDHRRRAPTPDEIKAMGNISIAYGAKGFMYYMVPTRADQPREGKKVFSQFGLFEEANKAFDPSEPDTWVQDPSEFRIELVGDVTVQTDGYNSDCSGIWSNPNMLIGGSSSPKQMESGGDPDSLKSLIKDVRRMIAHGQLRDALVVLTDIINGTADVRYKKSAVSLIPQCYEYVNMSELKSNLLSIRNVGGLFKFTTRLLMNIDTENMDTYKQEILNAGNNKAYGAGDNSEEVMMIYNNLLEEKYKSSGTIDTIGIVTPILTYLNSNFPTSEYTKSANLLFSEVSNSPSSGNGPMNKPQVSGTESVEMDYCLYNNYPNPFNPETVIKFSLKEKSNVTLTVFNIAGQKVAELVSGEMEKGIYENPDASGQRNQTLFRSLHFPFECSIT